MNVAINNLLSSAFHNKCDISTITPIGGLNNDNFKITYNNSNYFVRISSSSYI